MEKKYGWYYNDGLVQKRCNSSALAMELHLFRIKTSIWLQFIVKGIKNGCPCIVGIRGMQGCALVGDPARAVGECRDVAKAQP